MADTQNIKYAGLSLLDSNNEIDVRTLLPLGSFEYSSGVEPGRGVFEVDSTNYNGILNALIGGKGKLVFEDGVRSATMKNIYLIDGVVDVTDINNVGVKYRIYVEDKRTLWKNVFINKHFNVQTRDKDGINFETTSLNGASPYTWQEVFDHIFNALGLGAAPTIPTVVGIPHDIIFDYVDAATAIKQLCEELFININYSPRTDNFVFYPLGQGDTGALVETQIANQASNILHRGVDDQTIAYTVPTEVNFQYPVRDASVQGYRQPSDRTYIVNGVTGITSAQGAWTVPSATYWRIPGDAANATLLDNISTDKLTRIIAMLSLIREQVIFANILIFTEAGYIYKVRYTSNNNSVMTYLTLKDIGTKDPFSRNKSKEKMNIYDGNSGHVINKHGSNTIYAENQLNTDLDILTDLPTPTTQFVKKIQLDDFGRVVSITGGVPSGSGGGYISNVETLGPQPTVTGLMTIDISVASSVLTDLEGNQLDITDMVKYASGYFQANVELNGKPYQQVLLLPGSSGEWAIDDTTPGSEVIKVQAADLGSNSYYFRIDGER